MPTKRQFDMTIMAMVGFQFAWGLVKLWAHRKNAAATSGPLDRVAEAVVVAA